MWIFRVTKAKMEMLFAKHDQVSDGERYLRKLLEDTEKVIPGEAFERNHV